MRPPSRHHTFSGPCTRERDRAGGDRLAEPVHARVARRVAAVRGHVDDLGAAASRAGRAPPGSADGGTNTSSGQPTAAASVAAAIAALPHDAMASVGRSQRPSTAQPERLGSQQVQQDRDEVAGLVAAGDVAGLVLDPHATVVGEAERVD